MERLRWQIFAADRFPLFRDSIIKLAKKHRQFKDEPLHLAITYDPGRDREDIFLFEVLGNFGRNEVDPDKEWFEAAFPSASDFPLEKDQWLHLVLTNPAEFKQSLIEEWPSTKELRKAVCNKQYVVLHKDAKGQAMLKALEGQPKSSRRNKSDSSKMLARSGGI